ncbi:phosphoribosyltransferase family protein [Aequorivita vladivostokensis]|uniref:Phosphoribosyltransferase n=1 Tax=Aequorivita vladivostokensis TaxID=171194 RepID=A0ABR5DFK3_9FLAO|nr:phosphoribosyltransferase family protein [Aequorivita vladivostokensis]MAB58349.1 phosphoribosyltransferase [Aequorivita sp.]KJJ37545.1 phosphoribosyltransferase [Aequorivita vladivostokensis]MAO48674.1 phosphoribosyltransferase [Aequorivita sp.]MBF31687.1 phosphoribosyltransferase [Aequorivita sp.]HAV55871.1 phosphoribosyltransferase [Aequorivita sp.]|tara:strand:- start:80814 stop:81317 length:504 start_codon:yes stop_codon:yes gene_type:complete
MQEINTVILDKKQIAHKIKRIAYQIYETNVDETEVVIAGIQTNGFLLAKKLKIEVEKISPIKVMLCEVVIDKKNPTRPIETSLKQEEYKNKSLLLVDDVLHSGTTLIYGVKHFLEVPLKQFKTAVLVDRNHKKYPVKADFKGISLSTSLNENVSVIFEKNNDRAVLE